ncbi:MAG: tRNA dihydrouridine synthase DusB [Elusimicrobia bacterium]|nr:tRNA dihydrouridine synthase DusB [Elusimicrobiota bacterium]
MNSQPEFLSIGGVRCANRLVLAPMAGLTDSPFRLLCLESGAGLVCCEMVSAQAVKYGNRKTEAMLVLDQREHPVSVQIFGGEPQAVELAARAARDAGADIVDINAGCPVRKILKSGSGAALMRDESVFAAVVSAAVKAVSLPVTVKFRTGLRSGDGLGPRLAAIAQDSGAAAIAVHARPAENMHSGPPDLKALEAVCRVARVPVIGNGGVACAEDARRFLEAGCSGVMIGRAAVGNPLIFGEINAALAGKARRACSQGERVALFLRLFDMNAKRYGAETGFSRLKKAAGYWLKGFAGASGLRADFAQAKDPAAARNALSAALGQLH